MFVNTSLRILRTLIVLSLYIFVPTLASAIPAYPPDTVYNGPKTVPNIARPGYLQPITDPVFGTKVTRISDSSMGGNSSWEHVYSKHQAWNSDMTKLVAGPGTYIVDATTYKVIKEQGFRHEARWSTVDPNIMFYISGNGLNGNQFRKLNVTTGVDVLLRTFPEGAIHMGNAEGNISVGDQYVVFNVGTLAILYDIPNDTVLAKRDVAADAAGPVDGMSMSQSGKYIVVGSGNASPAGVLVYDRASFGNLSIKPRQIDDSDQHSDIGYDASGAETYVQDCPMEQRRLHDGFRRDLFPGTGYFWQCGHTSTRNYNLPGWSATSTYGNEGEVYSIKLDGSGTVRRFAHHRSTSREYYAQPRASISPDGSKVIWNSDWGDSGAPIYTYVAEMPGNGTPPPSSDTTPPTVSLTAPAAGATVSGTAVTVSANASDNVGVVGVQFKLDGVNLGGEDTAAPYAVTWNSTTATNASHTLTATARDAAGNTTTSAGVTVTANNGASSAPNLALNKPVTASSTESSSLVASNAVDGNTSTRWSSAYSDPEWIRVDLGAPKQINRVVLNWETAYGKSYKLQVSSDDVNWTDIYSTTTGDGGSDNLTGLTGTGRYLRMHGTVRGTIYGYSLWEMEVYGSDSAAPLSVSMNVACAPNCPLNGTTTAVTVSVLSGTPTSMEFSRDGFPVFLTCPGGAQCYPSPAWGFDWCISSSCWGGVSGQHTLNVTARNAAGQTATAAVTMNVSDSPKPAGLLPPGRLRITP